MFDSNLKQELDRQDDSGTVLTRTHCGGFCAERMPAGYVMHPKHFKYECASGLKYHKNTDTVETVRYDFDLIERAVHLYRNPFDTVVWKFFQLWFGTAGKDTAISWTHILKIKQDLLNGVLITTRMKEGLGQKKIGITLQITKMQ